MATIFRTRRGEQDFTEDGTPINRRTADMYTVGRAPCSFCGERPPTANWRGHDTVTCCQTCAINILPDLQADAIVGERVGPQTLANLHRAVDGPALAAFWQAAASAIFRIGQVDARLRAEAKGEGRR